MPHRHWFVVLTVDGVESRTAPYATRRTAQRKSEQDHGNAPSGVVNVVYDDTTRHDEAAEGSLGDSIESRFDAEKGADEYAPPQDPSEAAVLATTR